MPPRNDDSGSHATTPESGNPDFFCFCHAELVSASPVIDPEINSG